MIHTLQLTREIDKEELRYLTRRLGRPGYYKALYIQTPFIGRRRVNYVRSLSMPTYIKGCHKITFMRTIYRPEVHVRMNMDEILISNVHYKIVLEINPLTLISPLNDDKTQLFKATPYNVARFKRAFSLKIGKLLGEKYASLHPEDDDWNEGWVTRRIDYTFNIRFDSPAETQLFYNIVHRSSTFSRTHRRWLDSIDYEKQSAAEGTRSYKTLFYDKEEELSDHYDSKNKDLDVSVQGHNIIRMEHQCEKNEIKKIMGRFHLKNRNIEGFLSEDIAREMLTERYRKMVGTGDFYSRDRAVSLIESSNFTKQKKWKLIQFIDRVQEEIVSKVKRKFPYSASTFRSRMKDLRSLNISPVTLKENDSNITFIASIYSRLQRIGREKESSSIEKTVIRYDPSHFPAHASFIGRLFLVIRRAHRASMNNAPKFTSTA